MSIDLSQFHQVFFEESFEGLDIMEQALLGLDPENFESETINTIFRAAHSIKGGSATFKFNQVADFTHVMETLLDEMRNGERPITVTSVDLLLKSVDVLREVLGLLQQKAKVDESVYKAIFDQLNSLIDNEHSVANETATSTEEVTNSENTTATNNSSTHWFIEFKPQPQILRTGNEPIRMFRELESFGELVCVADISNIPTLAVLEEDSCCLSWRLGLVSNVERSAIDEVFEWVADECELEIKQVSKIELEELINGTKLVDAVDVSVEQKESQQTQAIEAANEANEGNQKETSNETNEASGTSIQVRQSTDVKSNEQVATTAVNTGGSSIRVGIDKVDSLINLVGELVITQSMLTQVSDDLTSANIELIREGLAQLQQNTRELQESVMQIRMLPISFVFNRFPRMVRDLSAKLNKKVELIIKGENTELDKTVMEQIGDPLVHLVRNSMDHGIETPEERLSKGKDQTGVVELNAFHQGGSIVIEIIDDGAGINKDKVKGKAIEKGIINTGDELSDEQIFQLIFEPGFSTAAIVSDVSGRGVGMDVVKQNISSLGGTVEVTSKPDKGSVFTIRLPLTLAILDGQLVRVGDQIYIIPLTAVVESLAVNPKDIVSVAGSMEVFKLRNVDVPILRLYETFGIKPENTEFDNTTIVVVEGAGFQMGFMVDELLAQQQVVIKSLESNFVAIEGISGATILGDGRVALILDVSGMQRRSARAKYKKRAKVA